MSENNPYDPSVPPSGIPDPTVHGPNPPAPQTFDDFNQPRSQEPFPVHDPAAVDQPASQPARADTGGAWIWGLFMIALGVVFLVNNMFGVRLENWWAMFILIPAIGSFRNAYQAYQRAGRLSGEARGGLMGGVALLTVAFIFLFGLDFGMMWPLLLVVAGAALLLNALLPG